MSERVKPILKWPGGKTRLLHLILPRITPHKCYCEPFAGGLAVLLAKERSEEEVVNDTNGTLVALYRNVQYHMAALLDEIEFALNARQNLHDYTKQPGLTEIQRAARWFVRNRISFAGHGRGMGKASSRENTMANIRELNRRLDKVRIENLPYEDCIRTHDSAKTFFFLDPPYLHANVGPYAGWTEEQMEGLRRVLNGVKGNWLLTVDGSEFNRKLFRDCRVRRVQTRNGSLNPGKVGEKTFSELIITPA